MAGQQRTVRKQIQRDTAGRVSGILEHG
jgi:hypothetical protein